MKVGPGALLGPYEILSAIGAGGMGEVYRARDGRLNRDVAIKLLPTAFSDDPERLRRFEQEARAAAALNHPSILAVYDIGAHDGAPYIVSELLEGETLADRVGASKGPLPLRKAMEIAIQIAHGLGVAHEKGIVHRDLKPANIFVTADGHVKILDFGLAKLIEPAAAGAVASAAPTVPPDTLPGVVLGTIGYMSPEQVRGLPADHRSDIFAFGAVLYEMLSGQRAFRGDTTVDTMSAILKEDPPDLPVATRHIPPALARIVDRCLEKNPAARFRSAEDLAFALEAISTHSDPVAEPAALLQRRRPTTGARERMVSALVGAVVVGALALGAAVYLRPAADDRVIQAALLPPPDVAIADVAGASILAGGTAPARKPDTDRGETEHWAPYFLPDGRHFLYLALGRKGGGTREPNGIYVESLDGGPRKLLVEGGSNAKFASGRLLFLRETTLFTQRFDPSRLELQGDPVPIAEQVLVGGGSGATGAFTVADNGILAYQRGGVVGSGAGVLSELVWFDRSGKPIATLGDRADYGDISLAPDGSRAAVSVLDAARRTRDLWIYEIARGLRTRFTFHSANELSPAWSPDGGRVVFESNRTGNADLYVKPITQATDEEVLVSTDLPDVASNWSPDGRFVLFARIAAGGGPDLWVVPTSGDRKPRVFLQTPFPENQARFSPDGQWVAYVSSESGPQQVYVAPFPGPGGKRQISAAGGGQPRWRRDGGELFFVSPDNRVFAAVVKG